MMKSKTDYFNARKCLGLGRDILKETPGVKYMPIRKRAKKSTVLYPTVTTPSLPTEGGSYTPRKWTVLLHLLPAGAAPPPTAPQRPSCTSLCAADAHDARRRPCAWRSTSVPRQLQRQHCRVPGAGPVLRGPEDVAHVRQRVASTLSDSDPGRRPPAAPGTVDPTEDVEGFVVPRRDQLTTPSSPTPRSRCQPHPACARLTPIYCQSHRPTSRPG